MTVRSENSMSPASNRGGPRDHERLRLVPENFRDLQGLNRAAVGAALLVMNIARLYGNGYYRPVFEALAILGLLAAFASLKYASRYYRWRVGWIEERTAEPHWSATVVGVAFWILVSLVVLANGFRQLKPRGVDLETLILLAAVFSYMSVSRPQLMRLRLPYLIPAFLVVAGGTLFPVWYITDDHQLELWRALDRSFLPFVLIAMGLGDHILLLRLMPKGVTADGEGGHDGE